MNQRHSSDFGGERAGPGAGSAIVADDTGSPAHSPGERSGRVAFGDCTLDLSTGELRAGHRRVALQHQPFRVLVRLLERPGELVTREALRRELWHHDTFVDFEHSLNAAVKRLREALGDSADAPRYIETLPRRGYRLITPARVLDRARAGASPARGARTRRAGAVIAGALLLAGAWALKVGWQTADLPRFGSIAVLPFENLTGDGRQDVVAEGLHEDILNGLSRLGSIRVTSRTSVMRYRDKTRLARDIARELRVDALVEGTCRQAAGSLQVDVRLVDAVRDTLLWSADYEHSDGDVPGTSARVVRDMAAQLNIRLTPQQSARLARSRAVTPAAEQAYLRGRHDVMGMVRPGGRDRMYASFGEAITLAPTFAAAYAARAYAHAYEGRAGFAQPAEAFALARQDAMRALELDPGLEEARAALGLSRLYLEWDWSAARRELRAALALNPNNSWLLVLYSDYLLVVGGIADATTYSRRALDLDPTSAIAAASVGGTLSAAGRFDEAVQICREGLEKEPGSVAAASCIEDNLYWAGRQTEALHEFASRLRGAPVAAVVERALATGGPKAAVRALGDYFAATGARGGGQEPFNMARFYAAGGDADRAFAWLERAFSERAPLLLQLRITPDFEPLHGDPRYQDLVRRIGFPPMPVPAAGP